ncbi:MAG TPA: efflux RND transporter periplasmic adaptor subunit [Gemmatimonadaceae bacterium]|nr:efflux RND transporter periplasmic adaptor subunit [Gemmatimonadaceae bacterium]
MNARITLLTFALIAAMLAVACGDGEKKTTTATAAATKQDDHGRGENHDEHAEGAAGGLTRVTLSPEAYRTAAIRTEAVRAELAGGIGEDLIVPAQVEYDPSHVAIISSRTPGRIERLLVVAGDRVSAGQTVALLSSREYVTAQNEVLQATRRAAALAGTQDEQGARAIAEAARRRLRMLGVSPGEIARLERTGEPRNELAIPAPFSGSIMEAGALVGEAVESGQKIFKLADLAIVDVVAAVPERAVPLVFRGQKALIGLAAFPHMQMSGTVEHIRDQLNPETRSVAAVIHTSNPGGRLRPGMFATARLEVRHQPISRDVGAAAERVAPLLSIASTAVVVDGEKRFAFVEVAERTFERRELQVVSLTPAGSSEPVTSRVGVRNGLAAGERVVVNGAFTLKSELGKAGLGHDH